MDPGRSAVDHVDQVRAIVSDDAGRQIIIVNHLIDPLQNLWISRYIGEPNHRLVTDDVIEEISADHRI